MSLADLPLTKKWLMDPTAPEAVPAGWVPGASLAERKSLHRLGGLVRGLLEEARSTASLHRPDDVALWLSEGAQADTAVRDEVGAALRIEPDQVLAGLYTGLVRSSNRRPLGTFFTPDAEAAFMLKRWSATQADPAHVVDVGAGVGVFTAAALAQWPSASLHAVDINPVTLGLLEMRLAAAERGRSKPTTSHPHLVLGDYLEWLSTSWPDLEGCRLVLGNPPYTRASLLPKEDRARITSSAGGLAGSRASLSTIMTAASLNSLKPRDGLCLLLPAQWLEARYAEALRQRLWALEARRIELRLFRSGLFKDAQVDAAMLLVGAEHRAPGFFVAPDMDGEPREIPRSGSAPSRWRSMVDGAEEVTPNLQTVTLGSLARVRRGTATGANDFFVLPDDIAGLLSDGVKVRLLRRLVRVGDVLEESSFDAALKGTRQWLLLAREAQRAHDSALDEYIRHGRELLVHERFICASRKHWFDLHHDLFQPDVVIGAMTKDRFHIVENHCAAAITNNLYGWTWHGSAATRTRERVLAWLRSPSGQEALRAQARQQGDGLFKIEPRALRELRIPTSLVRSG